MRKSRPLFPKFYFSYIYYRIILNYSAWYGLFYLHLYFGGSCVFIWLICCLETDKRCLVILLLHFFDFCFHLVFHFLLFSNHIFSGRDTAYCLSSFILFEHSCCLWSFLFPVFLRRRQDSSLECKNNLSIHSLDFTSTVIYFHRSRHSSASLWYRLTYVSWGERVAFRSPYICAFRMHFPLFRYPHPQDKNTEHVPEYGTQEHTAFNTRILIFAYSTQDYTSLPSIMDRWKRDCIPLHRIPCSSAYYYPEELFLSYGR